MSPSPLARKRERPDADDVGRCGSVHASALVPPQWRDRAMVVTSGVGLHAQMVADLAWEAAKRPQSGLVHDKVFCEPWSFKAERYAFWTRVRGCADRLAAMKPEVDALADEYEQRVSRIRRWVVPGVRLQSGRVLSERSLVHSLKNAQRERDAALEALYPEPMRVGGWRALRFYPQVVRTPAEAVAFVDPQATPEELHLAVGRGGLDALCAAYPDVLANYPALATAFVAHLATDAAALSASPWRVPAPRFHTEPVPEPHDKGTRPSTRAVRAETFVKHLRSLGAPALVATLVPPAAVAHLATVGLRTPTPKYVVFAARVLGLLPASALAPHADDLAEAVRVQNERVRMGVVSGPSVDYALRLLEKLTVKLHHPANVDMAAAHARAMAHCASE